MREAMRSNLIGADQDENPERKYKMYLENCIVRYELHEMIEDHEMQRHQTKFPNTNTNDREIETLLRCDATQREQTVDQAEQQDG